MNSAKVQYSMVSCKNLYSPPINIVNSETFL